MRDVWDMGKAILDRSELGRIELQVRIQVEWLYSKGEFDGQIFIEPCVCMVILDW